MHGREGFVSERRARPRWIPRELLVLTLQDENRSSGYGIVHDISESGASVVNDYPLPAGHEVRLRIHFNGSDDDFETPARVIWSQEETQPQDSVLGFALHGVQFMGLSHARKEELREVLTRGNGLKDRAMPAGRHRMRAVTTALVVLSLSIVVAIVAAGLAFHEIGSLGRQVESKVTHVERMGGQLEAGMRFDSRRQQLLLGIRDEIARVNPGVSVTEAYDYARFILRATEKYPAIDPLLFLSIGIVESGYRATATSPANAAGLYQIQPMTGRLIARTLDWEYSDEMLYDPERNTQMAALYLDILLSTYGDTELALAEYNGGPRNAWPYRVGSRRLAAETRAYVPNVMAVYERLLDRFESRRQRLQASAAPPMDETAGSSDGPP